MSCIEPSSGVLHFEKWWQLASAKLVNRLVIWPEQISTLTLLSLFFNRRRLICQILKSWVYWFVGPRGGSRNKLKTQHYRTILFSRASGCFRERRATLAFIWSCVSCSILVSTNSRRKYEITLSHIHTHTQPSESWKTQRVRIVTFTLEAKLNVYKNLSSLHRRTWGHCTRLTIRVHGICGGDVVPIAYRKQFNFAALLLWSRWNWIEVNCNEHLSHLNLWPCIPLRLLREEVRERERLRKRGENKREETSLQFI